MNIKKILLPATLCLLSFNVIAADNQINKANWIPTLDEYLKNGSTSEVNSNLVHNVI